MRAFTFILAAQMGAPMRLCGNIDVPFGGRARLYVPAYVLGLGRGQVVRHRFLVSAFAGSNPAAPAIFRK